MQQCCVQIITGHNDERTRTIGYCKISLMQFSFTLSIIVYLMSVVQMWTSVPYITVGVRNTRRVRTHLVVTIVSVTTVTRLTDLSVSVS